VRKDIKGESHIPAETKPRNTFDIVARFARKGGDSLFCHWMSMMTENDILQGILAHEQ